MDLSLVLTPRMVEAGWEANYYGDGFICPCGDEIEMDGECSEGHRSPLLTLGMI